MTDTTTPIVLIAPRSRWWAWIPAVVALIGLAVFAVSSLVPSSVIATTENPRLEEQQPAPYARTPASAESVNDRVVYNDLPDEVEVFDTNGDFFFVTVSAPTQSVLSWAIGTQDPVVDLLTEEGRNGNLTATQNRQIGLQQMRTATQEAQFVALSAAGYSPEINPGAVVVQEVLCRVLADDGFECEEEFPAADRAAFEALAGTPLPGAAPSTDEGNGPELGAYVERGDNAAMNAYARQEMAAGAQALLFRLYRQPRVEDMETMLSAIPLDQTSVHCSLRYPGQDPAELFRDLVRYLRRQDYELRSIAGSVDFDPLLDWSEPPFPPLIRLLYFVNRWMPKFRVLQVNAAGFNNGPEVADLELALALAKGIAYLKEIEVRKYPAQLACQHLQFALSLGNSGLVDTAKIGALRSLWPRALASIGIDNPGHTVIAAHSDTHSLLTDETANRTLLTAHGVSAARGGADLLFLAPTHGSEQPATTANREAVHRIYRMLRERPLAGEDVTIGLIREELERAAWERFESLQEQGGFADATSF